MKKLLAVLLSVSMLLMLASSCALAEEKTQVRLAGLKGPTSMGMVKLLSDAENGLTENDYQFTLAAMADEVTPLLLKGELDILAGPANLGAILYKNSGGAVRLAAVGVLGVLYIVEKGGDSIQSIEDLRGRTIYATGKGSTPEYALTYLLSQHGLDIASDVTIEWKSEPTEVVAQMATEDTSVAMMPQPYVTVASTQLQDLRIALDLTKEWDSLGNGSQLVTAGIIVRKTFAEEHPDALASFLKEYAASTAFTNEHPEEAAQLIEQYGMVKAAIGQKAIPYCNIVCITGEDMKQMVSGYFTVLFDQKPAAVGGELPGDDFYLIY